MQPVLRTRPPLTLVLGSAGTGKTEWALERFCTGRGSALLIVTSSRQADSHAEQAAERTGMPMSEARSAILPFYGLVTELLRHDPEGNRSFVGHAFQRMALQEIFQNTIRADDFLGKMLSAPGFIPAFQERIRIWKLAGVTPGALEAGAEAAEQHAMVPFAGKLNELARLYRAYEDFMQEHHLRDEEDGLLRSTHLVRSGKALVPFQARLIVVDGYFRLTRAQRDLLAALAERGVELGRPEVEIAITLSYEESRPLLFASPSRTLETLRAEFETKEILLSRRNCSSSGTGHQGLERTRQKPRPPVLTRLSAGLFAPAAAVSLDTLQESYRAEEVREPEAEPPASVGPARADAHSGSAGELQIFDAPNPYVEAEMTAREFRRLHDIAGIPWDGFAIILRTLGDYAPILSAVFERYDIPLGVDGPERLSDNPLLKTVLHLLDVVHHGWRREDVLAFLKSSYTAPDKLAADSFRKMAQAKGVRAGKERWLDLAAGAGKGGRVFDLPESLISTIREMARFDLLLTEQNAETHYFAELVKEAVRAFGIEERLLTGEWRRVECDKAALWEACASLDTLARMATLRERGPTPFAHFYSMLRAAWESATSSAVCKGEHVHVTEPYDAREFPVRVAAVMGLTERVFPRRITEDPFLRDDERRFLGDEGILHLEQQRLRSDDERFLFYLAVTAPSERLILTFPRSTRESDTLPSFYLDEVRAVVDAPLNEEGMRKQSAEGNEAGIGSLTVSRTLADVAPRWDDAVTQDDRLLAACADLFDSSPDETGGRTEERLTRVAQRMQQCLDTGELREWSRAVLVSRRLPPLPQLKIREIQADFVGQKQVYSAGELETYARCPFQYLLRYVFKLRPETEGLDGGMQSALLHSVLRRYFRKQARSGTREAAAPDEAAMQAELRALLNAALESAEMDASPHNVRMVQRRLSDDLDGFARREARFSQALAMTPTHFHLSFGLEARTVPLDPFSCVEPLWLNAADGGTAVAICGTIDRVDLDSTGQRALILDYDLGRPPEFSAIQRGESLQMPLHLLAMERVFGKIGAAACYDSMRETGRRRFHRAEHVNVRQFQPLLPLDDPSNVKPLSRDQYEDLTKTAEAAAVRTVRAIEAARVEATPGAHCKTCSYRDVCRTSVVEGHDGER